MPDRPKTNNEDAFKAYAGEAEVSIDALYALAMRATTANAGDDTEATVRMIAIAHKAEALRAEFEKLMKDVG